MDEQARLSYTISTTISCAGPLYVVYFNIHLIIYCGVYITFNVSLIWLSASFISSCLDTITKTPELTTKHSFIFTIFNLF